MKQLFLVGLSILIFTDAWASEKIQKSRTSQSSSMTISRAAPDRTYNTTPKRFGLGIASVDNFTGTPAALTGYIGLSDVDAVHVYFGVASTSPGFGFAVGGIFKHTIAESQGAGFHLGGGVSIGTQSTGARATPGVSSSVFAMGLTGLMGVHWAPSGLSHILLSVDGGPIFTLVDGESNMSIGGLSSLLGASVTYIF